MATTSKTSYTHTCDLCGAEHPRDGLRRFGLVAIREGDITFRNPEIQGPPGDVCPACQQRPIADLAALLEARRAEQAERDRPPGTLHRLAR
jgi:hypothetical protein